MTSPQSVGLSQATDPGQVTRLPDLRAAWYGLGAVIIASLLATIDVEVMGLVTEPFRIALHMTDTEIGALNGIALSLVAAIATYPLGWLADRFDRRVLLWICILVWSVATALAGLAQSYPQLFACSIGIAVGEAVLGPITYSIIPDLFPPNRWILANNIFFVVGVLGGAAGLTLGGALIGAIEAHRSTFPAGVAHIETWRFALLAVAVPGPLAAFLVALMRLKRAPPPVASSTNVSSLAAYIRIHVRTIAGVFIGFGLAAAAFGTIARWMPIALIRVFSEMPAQVGIHFGLVVAVGSVVGVSASFGLVRALRPRLGNRAPLFVAQCGIVAAAVVTPFYLLATTAVGVYTIAALQLSVVMMSLSLSPTMLQYIAPPDMRGRVIAVGGLIYIVFQSLSPFAVGIVSDRLTGAHSHLIGAMVIVAVPCFLLGAAFLRVADGSLAKTMIDAGLDVAA